jgi:excisionase family DNA binding protein
MTTSRRTVYTTGEAARLCQVAPRTVTKWFDAGKISGYRIPLGQERRIYRESLHRFMLQNGMIEAVRSATPRALLASNDPHLIDTLRRSLEPHWVVAVAGDWFELGRLANDSLGAVVLDFSFGTRGDMLAAVRWFAGRAPKPRILALLNEDECGPCEVLSAGADLAHARPADPHQLALALEPKVGAA